MVRKDTEVIGRACHEWDYGKRACAEWLEVKRLTGTQQPFFVSKLAVDADGAPSAYHRDDRRPWDNSRAAYDWLANVNVNDLHGIQGKDGATGPADGFYISATSLSDPRYPANDTRRWVDAAEIPYIVLSGKAFPWPGGATVRTGCLAFVVDTRTGTSSGAIYADVGRAVGEGSIALALRLGLRPFYPKCPPKVSGFGGRRFIYLVFPGTSSPPPWSAAAIEAAAQGALEVWGGEAQLRELFPDLPHLKGPRVGDTTIAGEGAAPEQAMPDWERSGWRGDDISKSELE